MFTPMCRHFPCLNRSRLSDARVMCPRRMANQMSAGCNPRVAEKYAHNPIGMINCETIEM